MKSLKSWHQSRETDAEIFRSLCILIEDKVIVDGDVMTLKDAYNTYVSLLEENGSEDYSSLTYT